MAASALDFVPMGTKLETLPANLTERRFRHFWERSDRLLHPPSRRFDDLDLSDLPRTSSATTVTPIGEVIRRPIVVADFLDIGVRVPRTATDPFEPMAIR